jgi:hypothetical protein
MCHRAAMRETSSMYFLKNRIAAMEAWFGRRTAALDHPRAPLIVAVVTPVLFGLLSLLLGQDDNWDMKNYHWYNPYALLNGRVGVDMAPGQWQSYFNPTIDIPYYLLTSWFPGPVAGFAMGLLHGLNFILVLAIARQLRDSRVAGEPYRVPVLLAAAGMCGAGFLSELGNTMGDNMTSLLVLSSLFIALRYWERLHHWSMRAALTALGSGLVMGLGTGLKLTNATYAVALCLALLTVPTTFWQRLRMAVIFGLGVVAGIAVSAGYWFLTMWRTFGNPVFPQFNNVFRSPLAQQLGVIDNFHMPHSVAEAVFWPFVFTANFTRVSELVLKQAIMPVLYLVAIVFAGFWLIERLAGKGPRRPFSPRARFLLLFGAVGYLAWMKLFGIYRYLIPLELLAPLMVWILFKRMVATVPARRIAGWVITVSTLAVFPFVTWGHAGWAAKSFSAEVPVMAQPASTVIFIAHGHPPMGWLATFFPKEVRVISLGSGFPESPAYVERINQVLASRPGPHYVMLFASKNEKESGLRRKLALATALGLTGDAQGCGRLDRFLRRVRFQVQVKQLPAGASPQCTLELQPEFLGDMRAQDSTIIAAAEQNLARYGLKLDGASCSIYPAAIGAEPYPYQLCRVTVQR